MSTHLSLQLLCSGSAVLVSLLVAGVGLFNYIKLVGLRKGTIRAKPLTTNIKSTGTDVSP